MIELSAIHVEVGTDLMTCPTCHRTMEPEFKQDRHSQPEIALRARCGGCGRLWVGLLASDSGELSSVAPERLAGCRDLACECSCHE